LIIDHAVALDLHEERGRGVVDQALVEIEGALLVILGRRGEAGKAGTRPHQRVGQSLQGWRQGGAT